jgi:predicted TPR repeat methyltransferase
VDISEKMLDKARERGGYDELVPAEITAYMEDHPERFDLVASADTLCYFGDLEGVVAAAASALRPGGVLTFTVEKADEAKGARDYELKQTGRYVHQRDYVVRTLRARGLDPEHIEDVVLREEAGEPVAGFLVLARRRG